MHGGNSLAHRILHKLPLTAWACKRVKLQGCGMTNRDGRASHAHARESSQAKLHPEDQICRGQWPAPLLNTSLDWWTAPASRHD